ncbi:MAG: DMT family transporter [Rhodospirillaceae bacterium]|nr:DMT family transporter [Rhodospirillaceae bacterium]
MLLSVLLFATMDLVIKWVSADYPIVQIVFFRNAFAFLPIALALRRNGGVASLRTRALGAHVLRGALGIASMYLGFWGLALLPLGDAVALGQSAPIFVTALSVPLLGERVGVRRWSAVTAGFLGVVLMTRPGSGLFDPAALLPLAGAAAYGLVVILVRRLNRTEAPTTIVFYFTLFAVVVSGSALPFVWVGPDLVDFLLLAGIGILGGCAQLAVTYAFRLAPVAVVAPFDYLSLVFAMVFGYAVWREVPDLWLLSGAAIVVASGLYILRRETRLGRRRPVPALRP